MWTCINTGGSKTPPYRNFITDVIHRKHIKKDRYTVYRSFDLPNNYSRPATKSPIWAVVTGRKPSS